MKFLKKPHIVLLIVILFLGFLVRLYGFNNPIADWHSWRQVDTSAVSRNFVANGFDVLHPRYDDISNVQTGVDNPEGYRFVEFPLYNVFQAGFYTVFGIFTLEQWGRLVSIISSVLTGLFLYLLVSRHSNRQLGLLSAFFYMFIPFNIFYGRTILPDTMMVMAVTGGIYFFDRWVEERAKKKKKLSTQYLFLLLTFIFTASSMLLKPYAAFFVLPMLAIAYQQWGWGLFKVWELYVLGALSVVPLFWWRVWIMQFPEGVPKNLWLLNGNGIRFRPAFFRWIVYERLIKLLSGYLGIVVFLYGAFKVWTMKEKWFFLSFAISSILYVTIFASGNVQHDYYQILIMPSVAIFFAIGSFYLARLTFKKLPIGRIILLPALFCLFWFGWAQVRGYFDFNPVLQTAGEAVDRLAPKDAKVLAFRTGDTTLLYYTKRKGWPHNQASVPELIQKGATHMVFVYPTKEELEYGKTYKVLERTDTYVVYDLRK